MKTIITVTGIRPDFIRMSEIFKKLDQNFHHILVHTGQHYDRYLSDIFFKEFEIRKPDFNLNIGSKNNEHFHQLSTLAIKFISLIRKKNIKPSLIIFLGDSNSVGLSFFLKKEGYKIAHIEAGMRSYDDRMLEEINRKVCDHCSDLLFVYHNDYKKNLLKENIKSKKIFVVGNTIVEPLAYFSKKIKPSSNQNDYILVDIHRPENFKYPVRLKNIFKYVEFCKKFFKKKIYFLEFKRTIYYIKKFKINTSNVSFTPLMSYTDFLRFQKNSYFIISDSGTAQEEPSLLHRPVIVPRDFSERPQSYANNCSFKINVNIKDFSWLKSIYWINKYKNNKIRKNNRWLGNGKTSSKIIEILKKYI
jgi:UDP-N-acetylglucosamine 2-epimerase